ncbi:MAG: sigma factor G inhibitor Gin [Alicyclobacillaceae bacterium]|nr:sigma factor G inhibitor Gin [Alicyclobacillaceae bacterium]
MEAPQAECIVCGRQQTRGIFVCGQFICSECEQAIVHTDVEDEKYQHYVDCMKRIWWSALS